MSDVRVGLIGFGLAGETFHAPLISTTDGLRLAAVVTNNPERRASAERQYPGVGLVTTVEELFRMASELDLVVVGSPNGTHFEYATTAMEAGLSVVVDKPFAGTAAEGRSLIETARRRGVHVFPFQNRRWDGDFLTVRRLIAEDKLGAIVRFESRFERWRLVPKPRWMAPGAAAAREGIIYDLHTHLIDQALVLFGRVTGVYAETARRRAGVQVDDDAFIALTHASGVRSHLVATLVAAQIGPRYRVYGDRGAFIKYGVDPQEEMLRAGRRPRDPGFGEDAREHWGTLGDGETTTTIPTERGVYTEFYAGVVASLRDGAPPPVAPEDSVAGLEIVEAAYRSADERRVVSV
ncbi:MAG TPA: Gfo/Idh/MocA family oxidoreductase [Gemmatimonadaceae bacterium]